MRPLQLLIAALLGACIVLVILLATTKRECTLIAEAPAAVPVQIVDADCASCYSGSGPSAWELAGLVELADDERIVAVDRQPTKPSEQFMLVELIDAAYGRQREHGQAMEFDIAGPRGKRRVALVLH